MERTITQCLFMCASIAIAMLFSGISAKAATIIDFDSVNATGGSVNASTYLSTFGVTLSGVTSGTNVVILNDINIYGGVPVVPASAPNVMTQLGSNAPVTFTLNFSSSLDSFMFTRPQLMPGPSGVTFPAWQAYAFAGGTQIGSVAAGAFGSYSIVPAATYTFNGPGITSVRFDSQNSGTGFSAVLLDNLVLTTRDVSAVPEPSSFLLMISGLAGIGFWGHRKIGTTPK